MNGESEAGNQEPHRAHSKVVVGVDGSESSLRALDWAMRYTALTDSTLEVVTAWTFPERPAPLGVDVRVPFQEELMAEAERKLSELVAGAVPDDQRAAVRTKVVRGEAAKVLVAEAAGAELLVVGSRGRGSFAQLLLGSVSERCAQHAECPVLVMR